MAIVYRTPGPWGAGKGSDLTPVEADNDLWELFQGITAKAVQGVGIANIIQTGNQLTFVLTDHTLLGPYTLPGLTIRFPGEWQPDFPYIAGDIITHSGSIYGVNVNHTSQATFDPFANDGHGTNFYTLLLEFPALSIPTGGAVGTFLRKSGLADYASAWLTAALADLSDVSLPTSPPPVTGDVLTFSGGLWGASPVAVSLALSQLTDVDVLVSPSPTTGQLLTWDGLAWTNANPAFAATISFPAEGQLLVYDATSGTWKNQNTADIPVFDNGGRSGTITLDYSHGAAQRITMSGGTTLNSVTNWPAAGQFGRLVLEITNPGASTWTWPTTGYQWPGGSAPEISVNGRDIYALTTFDGGHVVSGSIIGQNYL